MRNIYKQVLIGIALVATATAFIAFPTPAEGVHDFLRAWRVFTNPGAIAVDPSNQYVYVTLPCYNRVRRWTACGRRGFQDMIAGPAKYAKFSMGVAVDSSGNIYVADSGNHRIQKFNVNGWFITRWGSYGSGDGEFNGPMGIAVDSLDNVYVAGQNNHRIQKFKREPDGSYTFVTKWGSYGSGDGQFRMPHGVALDSSENVYVADIFNNRIQKFDADGNFITKWGSHGSGDGQFKYPHGVAVDSLGNIYVTDTNNHRIQKFDSGGGYITQWGSSAPWGIAVDRSRGNIYVGSTGNDRIEKFGELTPTNPPNYPPVVDAGLDQTAGANSDVTFDGSASYDPDGDPLTYTWDFGDGSPVASGVTVIHQYSNFGIYTATLTVKDTWSATDSDGCVIKGSTTGSDTCVVDASNAPPVADAGLDQTNLCTGYDVTFDGSGSTDPDGDPLEYTWDDFGDGSPVASGVTVIHQYSNFGTYTVTLTVKDTYDATDSDTCTVDVGCEKSTGNFQVDLDCCVKNGFYIDLETGLTIRGTYEADIITTFDPTKATHGSYVSCVAHMVNQLRREGKISANEGGEIVRAAGQSDVNKPEGSIH